MMYKHFELKNILTFYDPINIFSDECKFRMLGNLIHFLKKKI